MTSTPGDRFTIRIGGDASGPVVAGHENHVEIHQDRPPTPAGDIASPDTDTDTDTGTGTGADQINTANDHGTVYTVMQGDLHIHHEGSGEAPEGSSPS
ncbi:hypothetical protein ACIPYQ_22390 [Streptomyces sp. NPDC090045]|uniref:hypothetical protein n=1 Tax=Streptomyces sp. NPDC090045 TaxID=3365927 RepID=UPI0037FC3B61